MVTFIGHNFVYSTKP